MNAYGMEDPIAALGNAGLANQVERFLRRGGVPYSYVFDGEAGYLDHALATASLGRQVLGVAEWHINADEPSVIDYNTEFKPQDLYAPSPYRASDHDPVVVSLQPCRAAAAMSRASSRRQLRQHGEPRHRHLQHHGYADEHWQHRAQHRVSGPVQLVVGGLPAGITLANATGSATACLASW